MNRNAAFGVGALLGAAAALVWDRRKRLGPAPATPAPETRQRELREKLAGAQQPEPPSPAPEPPSPAPEPPSPAPEPSGPPPEPPPAPPPPPPEAKPPPQPPEAKSPPPPPEAKPPPPHPPGPPPADEFEAMRRRIHEEGKAAAEDMRRAPDDAS